MPVLLRLTSALAPLLLTPVLVFAIAGGVLNFGGGEKDVFLAIPWLVWSLFFAIGALGGWWRGLSHPRALVWAVVWSTGAVVVLGFTLLIGGPGVLGATG